MKLPNAESAIVDIRKIRDYYLPPVHPRGKPKARVFELVLGITAEDSIMLAGVLERAAAENELQSVTRSASLFAASNSRPFSAYVSSSACPR